MKKNKKVKVSVDHREGNHVSEERYGLSLMAMAMKGSMPIEFDCKKADCGICILRVKEGHENLSAKTHDEKDFLQAMHADEHERLACQCRVFGDVHLINEFG